MSCPPTRKYNPPPLASGLSMNPALGTKVDRPLWDGENRAYGVKENEMLSFASQVYEPIVVCARASLAATAFHC